MSTNILVTWIICCLLISLTEPKLKALQFRTLPLKSEKLTIAELPSYNLFEPYGPGTYAFGYEIEDTSSNNIQFRDEEKLENGTVRGSYGLVRPNGLVSITRYFADSTGYHSSTQTFNQNDKKPTLLTSTLPPFMSSPSDVMFLDVPNPATISSVVAQNILEQNKVDLATQSSNIPITEIFSSPDEDLDSKNSPQPLSLFNEKLKPPSHIPNLPIPGSIEVPNQNMNTNEKENTNFSMNNSKPSLDETFNILQKPPGPPEIGGIFGPLLPHIPQLPTLPSITQSSQEPASTTASSFSDEKNNDKPTSQSQQPNIFENILPHIPQLPFPSNMLIPSTESTVPQSNNLSDTTETESSSTSTISTTTTSKPSSTNFPQFPNIFENILPHVPQFPLPINIVSTTTTQTPMSTSTTSNLSDENASESPMSTDQPSIAIATTSKPAVSAGGFPSLSEIFGFINPVNFPIFKPPGNTANKQETTDISTTEASTPVMDSIFDTSGPKEPVFAILHKNATIVPIYDDDGTTIGIQLVNNYIPSNFHIVPFLIPTNYFHNSVTTEQPQNIAHDEVSFEETVPNFVNDKFHDPLTEIEGDNSWKSNISRKKKGGKRFKVRKVRRNHNPRKRFSQLN